MKYQNANNLLPPELLREIQRYWQGGYLYIPKIAEDQPVKETTYQVELSKRNEHIYQKHLQGWRGRDLAAHYNLSGSSIRRILLNVRKEADTMHDKIHQVLQNWNLINSTLVQRDTSVWEVGETYMLKAYQDIPSAQRNADILRQLRLAGIPAAEVISTADGKPFFRDEEKAYLMTRKLPGKPYAGPIDSAFAHRLGNILAQLHLAFQNVDSIIPVWNNSLLDELKGWICEKLEENNWEVIPRAVYDEIVSNLSDCYSGLAVQMIHRDVHTGNFLFSDGAFSGYIDFDLSQRNIRIFDLCYFLAGLLAKETAATLADPWSQIAAAAVAGYEARCPLSREEKAAIPLVMQAIEILFAAYFISIQDFACASDAAQVMRRIREENLILR